MAKKTWTESELEEFAEEHVEYEVRKLIEYASHLEIGSRDTLGVEGQAVLEASLIHLRLLHEFLERPRQADAAHARLWVPCWNETGFLSGPEYGRISQQVAHLSKSRLTHARHWQPAEISALAHRCLMRFREFIESLEGTPCEASFAKSSDQVTAFLDRRSAGSS